MTDTTIGKLKTRVTMKSIVSGGDKVWPAHPTSPDTKQQIVPHHSHRRVPVQASTPLASDTNAGQLYCSSV